MATTTKKNIKEPLPKEGTFWKYFFWFLSSYTKEFIAILLLSFMIVFILSSDVGFYEDIKGEWHFTLDKKAMRFKMLKSLPLKEVKK